MSICYNKSFDWRAGFPKAFNLGLKKDSLKVGTILENIWPLEKNSF